MTRKRAEFVAQYNHPALEFERLTYIRSVEESKALNNMEGPMIILSASGMAETGRILHHLKNNIEDPRNMILIVSWQAPDTLGPPAGRPGRARDASLARNMSAGPGWRPLAGFRGMPGRICWWSMRRPRGDRVAGCKHIFLVHGEPEKAEVLQIRLAEAGLTRVVLPGSCDRSSCTVETGRWIFRIRWIRYVMV